MRRALAVLVLGAVAVVDGGDAIAQPRPKGPPKEAPGSKDLPPPPPDKTEGPSATSAEALAVVAGGLTADQAAKRAVTTSVSVRASEETLESLSAKADVTLIGYFPRLDLLGTYTHYSHLTPPEISPGVRAKVTFDYYVAQATLTVPITDYLLKTPHTRAAALHAEEAGENDVAVARAKAFYDGKVAYYNWLRAKAAVSVADQSLTVAKAHLRDTESLFNVGKVSKADVLRAQTEAGTSQLLVEKAKATVALAERQLRTLIHMREDEVLNPGEALDAALPELTTNVKALLDEAIANRPELRSFDKTAESAHESAKAARAARYPVLTAFGDALYANPNTRRFVIVNEFFPTWDVGAKLTWSLNDFLTAGPTAADYEARASTAEANKLVQRDAVDVEVIGAIQDVLQSDVSIKVTEQQLESATEGYRVARELFLAGRFTGTALIDSETALVQSRFNHVNARVDARIARTRLDYVLGRIARVASNPR